MFDRIAHRYDLLNHLLSFNRDKAWRRKMTTLLPKRCDMNLLDLATGTADQLLAIYNSGQIARGVGLDPAEEMLAQMELGELDSSKPINDAPTQDQLEDTGEQKVVELPSVD